LAFHRVVQACLLWQVPGEGNLGRQAIDISG
jgi:hypothetical protein